MAYQVLYRKYRPKTFEEVVGQDHIVKTLVNAIEKGKISHAYLFCGPRGTGKTTIAKLFAKALNCTGQTHPCGECANCRAISDGSFPDLFELDAASNNSVDNIRSLIENATFQPMLGKYKIYILDEVHMLSASAANALLKTLEEPPTHVIFILATTDPQKLLLTILSRCQRYNFAKVANEDMKRRLTQILDKEEITYDDAALDIICDLADGCVRDALSYLDEALAFGDYKLESKQLEQMFGLMTKEAKVDLLIDIKSKRSDDAITKVKDLYRQGIDIKILTQDLIKVYKDTVIFSKTDSTRLLSSIEKKDAERIKEYYSDDEMLKAIDILLKALENYRKGQDQLSYFEIVILKIADLTPQKELIKQTSPVFDEEIPSPKAAKEEIKLTLDEVSFKKDELLAILREASKEEKNKASVIYEKIHDFSFDESKRKYYSLLKDTEIFASSKDMIIFTSFSESNVHQINDLENNKDIYYFLNDEFGIDKMIYAIDVKERETLGRSFVASKNEDLAPYIVKRYPQREAKSLEKVLKDTFGKVAIVDE